MPKTYTIDEHGNRHEVDWYDFMTNDNNPTLCRMAEKLLQDPEFRRTLKEDGYEGFDDEN